jgi:hypothetical protein
MGSINLTGRLPRPLATISGRLVATGVVVFLLLVGAVVYGFRYRLQKQQARKDQQQSQLVAADAAQSNRQSVEGEMPVSSVTSAQPSAAGPSTSIATPLVNAARTVAQPFSTPANTLP